MWASFSTYGNFKIFITNVKRLHIVIGFGCENVKMKSFSYPNFSYLSNSVLETEKCCEPVLILFPVESSPSEYDPPSPNNNGSIEPSRVLLLARRDVDPLPEWVDPSIPDAKECGTLFLLCRLLMEMCSDIALLACNERIK